MSDFTPQQQAAINGRGNLLVVAGAGTGKTRTLIARCLRLVTEERVSLENILMVTFTEAAAAEMRARLRKELRGLQSARPDDEHLAEQLALLDAARICTLHSFCLQLARAHFHELGLDPQFSVLDEQQTRPLMRAALDELLERHYAGTDGESRAAQELIRGVGRGSDGRIRKLIIKLHTYSQSLPDPARWLDEQQERFAQTAPDEWRRLFIEAVGVWRDEWLAALEGGDPGVPAVELCLSALKKLPAQPALADAAEALQAVRDADRRDGNWPRGTKGKVRDPLRKFFEEMEFLGALVPDHSGSDPLAQDWEWVRHHSASLVALTREFTAEFTRAKREQGGVDFADLEQCALCVLRRDAGAREWRERLAHVFVDEYQDINEAQDAILTMLGRDGSDGNRFMVGDVKQSIYRFRRANPKIFSRYAARWAGAGAEGKRIPLTENFRSRAALLDFINPLFAALMREEVGGVAYEPLQFGAPARRAALTAKSGEAPRAEFHLIARTGEEADADETAEAEDKAATPDLLAVEREARLAARRLCELKESGHPIWDDDQKAFRPVEWRDMAVLLRSPAGRAEAFAMEFNRAGVPLAAARDGFFASLEITDLVNLLKLLDNPLQDVPLLAVLRSPLVGMSLDELVEARLAARKELFWTALVASQRSEVRGQKGEAPSKVSLFLNQFARWRELVKQTSLTQCLETALADTHYETLLLAGPRGAERAANVRKLLDFARQFDPYQRQGLYRFLRFVQAQVDEELDLQPAEPPIADAVKLVSIHKSKGLEFPVVVLAGMGTKFNEQDLNEPVLLSERYGLCPRITPPGAAQSYPGLTHWLARRAERRELRGEELRLLYVALTRARDTLILVGTTNRKADTAKWESGPQAAVETNDVADAWSHLDWLLTWLPRAIPEADWTAPRNGQNSLLRWRIYDENDAEFAEAPIPDVRQATITGPGLQGTNVFEAVKGRVSETYPFPAASTTAAKTSVSALRRRGADETDDEAQRLFTAQVRRRPATSSTGANGLSAAERGTAHHTFLELFDLAQTGGEAELRAEAERLLRVGRMTVEQTAALDFGALAGFWQSEIGRKIRAQAANVQRELAFTARFEPAELDTIVGGAAGGNLAGEFVIVQGVADLVAVQPREIWLLDFKTDELQPGDLERKSADYSRQLRLYALALSRILGRDVTECWLHFFAAQQTISVDLRVPRERLPPTAGTPLR